MGGERPLAFPPEADVPQPTLLGRSVHDRVFSEAAMFLSGKWENICDCATTTITQIGSVVVLDHVSITVVDFAAAEAFYDATLKPLGVSKVGSDQSEGWIGYGLRCDADHPDRTYLSIRRGPSAEDAPGRHWCFKAPNRLAVDAFWKAGLINGGTDNGAPGLRPAYHSFYYAAFLIDPSGNRVEAVCHQSE